ncbi:hypothetical protein G6F63_012551 [Rhizopus arrhizus]|nr:hypothetical protein G6F63_012551 [Rhizopus arrhizus]
MAHKDWTIDDWKRVIWSDETKINRFNSDGRTWTWIRSGESLKSHHVKMTVKHGAGSIMLWSAITYAGVGWMCKINGNMDKELYKEILEDELERTIEYGVNRLGFERHQVIFQHDNDSKHTSKVVKEYLQKQSYTVLQWPAQSPDLNPIENMWSLLKRRLNDYETAPKGMNELYERVTKVCNSTNDSERQNYKTLGQFWESLYVPNRQDFETIQDYVNTMVNTYFVKFCQLEGYEALEKAVGNWLLECEEEFGGPGSIGYGERGQFLPREEGAVLIAKEIKDKAEIISILDIPSPTDNTPVMVPAILPPSDKIPEPQATYSDAQDEYLTPSLFEDWEWAIRTTGIELARKQMARTFYKYQEIVQHQKQMTLMKQQLTLRFAEDVNYWSHLNMPT